MGFDFLFSSPAEMYPIVFPARECSAHDAANIFLKLEVRRTTAQIVVFAYKYARTEFPES